MGESVRVAVRVRPFNGRENDRNAKCVINMVDKMTQITDPDNPGQPPKEFSFDFSYWSHDSFHVDERGYNVPDGPKYADQRKVFDDLGQGVLDNAVEGFNCSLFAYGQTGAGKSYSMVGYGSNKGIVPITCDELFKIIEGDTGSGTKYQVTFSMLEIYNEQVRDLLSKDNPKGGLPVRQNPKIGAFYVQGLKNVAVGSYKEIEKRTEEGTANRTVASTQMNATSSRAHTVVTIAFDQIKKNEMGQETKKTSIINLVDLAGSERADSTGATGDRLKEGANINKSLSALGNVISALADLSMGKKKVLVPYRDSVLTKLLQNALGGNSKTIMIAALSPADINYDETLSTLRYADRAKKIKNKAVVNENPMDKLIRELKEENERLKKSLGGNLDLGSGGGGMTPEEKEKMRKEMEEEIRAQLDANSQAMMSWDEKLENSRREDTGTADATADKVNKIPHLVNMNEDPMLSGVVKHFIDEGEMTIGRKDGDPDLIMSGLSIQKLHAVLSHNGGEVTLKPGTPGAKTKVNGLPLTGERVLKHLDRVLLGSNHWYYFFNPLNKEKSEGTPDTVDWDFAQKEIAQSKGFQTGLGSGLSKEQVEAQEQVLELLPMVSEVNAISEELDKHKSFEVILISGAIQDANHGKGTKVMVKMKNMLNDNTWLWDRGRFMNRRFIMADIYQRFLDGEDVSKMPKEEDPFWEPPEDVLVGTANVFLQSLSYALDFDDKLAITDYKGSEEGSIIVNVTPCTSSGKILDEDYFVDDPKDLLGKPYHFKVQIRSSEVQKAKYSSGLYVKYKTLGDTEWTETPVVERTTSPEFNHSKLFSFPAITEEHLEWFDSGCIAFHVYAKQVDSVADARLLKMTTKELRQMEHIQKPTVTHRGSVYQPNPNAESAQVKSELILLKRKYDRLAKKEKRIQDLVTEWGQKPAEEKSFDSFYRAMHAAAFYQRGQLKYKVNMLQSLKTYYLPGENEDSELSLLEDGSEESCYLKNQPDTTANGGTIKTEVKGGQGGSKACSVM